MTKIADILEILGDGKWHTLGEIQRRTGTNKDRVQKIIEFLGEYDFIVIDETKSKIRLEKLAQEFLDQTASA